MNSATARKEPEQNSPFCWALLAMVNVREETKPLVSSPREEQRSTGAHPSPGAAIQPAVQQKHGQAHRKEKNARNHSVKNSKCYSWLNTLGQIHHLWKDKRKTGPGQPRNLLSTQQNLPPQLPHQTTLHLPFKTYPTAASPQVVVSLFSWG